MPVEMWLPLGLNIVGVYCLLGANVLSRLRAAQFFVLAILNGLILLVLNGRWWLILGGFGYHLPYLTLTGYRLAAFGVSYFTPGPLLLPKAGRSRTTTGTTSRTWWTTCWRATTCPNRPPTRRESNLFQIQRAGNQPEPRSLKVQASEAMIPGIRWGRLEKFSVTA